MIDSLFWILGGVLHTVLFGLGMVVILTGVWRFARYLERKLLS